MWPFPRMDQRSSLQATAFSPARMVAPLGFRPPQWERVVSFNGEAWPCLQMVPRWRPVATVRFGPAWIRVPPGFGRRTLTPTHICVAVARMLVADLELGRKISVLAPRRSGPALPCPMMVPKWWRRHTDPRFGSVETLGTFGKRPLVPPVKYGLMWPSLPMAQR